ncbi:UNVERIFIED_CONTAM: hypothetical protein FKN15_047694 [Acipenser sinensis]
MFGRDKLKAQTQGEEKAVLKSFRSLSENVKINNDEKAEPDGNDSEGIEDKDPGLEERADNGNAKVFETNKSKVLIRDDIEGSENETTATSPPQSPSVPAPTGGDAKDADLVRVTLVHTTSDTESEDEDDANMSELEAISYTPHRTSVSSQEQENMNRVDSTKGRSVDMVDTKSVASDSSLQSQGLQNQSVSIDKPSKEEDSESEKEFQATLPDVPTGVTSPDVPASVTKTVVSFEDTEPDEVSASIGSPNGIPEAGSSLAIADADLSAGSTKTVVSFEDTEPDEVSASIGQSDGPSGIPEPGSSPAIADADLSAGNTKPGDTEADKSKDVNPISNVDSAFNAFKLFFNPRPLKKNSAAVEPDVSNGVTKAEGPTDLARLDLSDGITEPDMFTGTIQQEGPMALTTSDNSSPMEEELDDSSSIAKPDVHSAVVKDTLPGSTVTDEPASIMQPEVPAANKNQSVPSAVTKPDVPTFSPTKSTTPVSATPGEKSFQLPALFSGLRVLKKGAVGEERETVSEIKLRDTDLAMLSLTKPVNKVKLQPEPLPKKREIKNVPEPKNNSGFLEQLTQLLNLDGPKSEDKEDASKEAGDVTNADVQSNVKVDESKDVDPPADGETALSAFKSFFTPKTVKKDNSDVEDLDTVKKKLKHDRDVLKGIFQRSTSKPGPAENNTGQAEEALSELASPTDSDDRMPKRLVAVWPPPKPKEEEEKMGLKYTEAAVVGDACR